MTLSVTIKLAIARQRTLQNRSTPDTVNAAFRLESATKEMGRDLAIGATTYSYLTGLPYLHQAFDQHTVSLKGYDDSTITYGTTFDDLDRFLDANSSEEMTGITGVASRVGFED